VRGHTHTHTHKVENREREREKEAHLNMTHSARLLLNTPLPFVTTYFPPLSENSGHCKWSKPFRCRGGGRVVSDWRCTCWSCTYAHTHAHMHICPYQRRHPVSSAGPAGRPGMAQASPHSQRPPAGSWRGRSLR